MNIGMIGAGFVGRAIAKLAVQSGHQVMVSNSRGPHTLFSLPYAVGCKIGTVAEAAAFGDLIVIAIPLVAYATMPVAALAGKIVIDANNYYPQRDGAIAQLDDYSMTSSELLAHHLTGSHVIKAFNSIPMPDLETRGCPPQHADRLALPMAGDYQEDKAKVAMLLDEFGFDYIDAGALSESWRFEPGTPAYCALLNRAALVSTLAATNRENLKR